MEYVSGWLSAHGAVSMSGVAPGPIFFLFIGVPFGEFLMVTVRFGFPPLIGTFFVAVPGMAVTVSRVVRAIRTAVEGSSSGDRHRKQNGREIFSSACHLNIAPWQHS